MERSRFQCVIRLPLSCFLWNMVPRLLCIFSANTLDTSAFRIQRVERADNCHDHTMHFRPTFVLAGEPTVLKCPPLIYKHMDVFDWPFNVTWNKNGSTTIIPAGYRETRILSEDGALWFLPASVEDSGVYICTQRNSSYCADVSVYLTVFEKSAAQDMSYIQKAFTFSSGKVVCPVLEDFIEKNTNYELRWYKDSAPLDIDNKKFVVLKGINYLIINSVSLNDSGYYTCQMAFEHGTAQYNITRTIHLETLGQKKKSSPVIVYPNQKITLAALGSRLTIICKVFVGESSHFYTDVWWLANKSYLGITYQNGRVTEGERQELVENDENYIEVALIFDPVEEADFNTDFTCVAHNSIGHEVRAAQVKQEEHDLSWYLALIPMAVAVLIVGGLCMHKCWKQRSARGYIATKS
ncbi:interleukin-1 receptor type 2 [Rhineura floridana]|uniref:interleukin-1 receptor type 2 n=1 Tax=Rhineura floridana TaxID=261503 RepID=UPI002AC84CBB|nr:interleukin-1 receptor type 2 [Rhineura floridana]